MKQGPFKRKAREGYGGTAVSRGGGVRSRTETSRPRAPQAQQLTGTVNCLSEKGVLPSHVWCETQAPLILVEMT